MQLKVRQLRAIAKENKHMVSHSVLQKQVLKPVNSKVSLFFNQSAAVSRDLKESKD